MYSVWRGGQCLAPVVAGPGLLPGAGDWLRLLSGENKWLGLLSGVGNWLRLPAGASN